MTLDEARDALLKAAELVKALEDIQASGDLTRVLDVAKRELKRAADQYEAAVATQGMQT